MIRDTAILGSSKYYIAANIQLEVPHTLFEWIGTQECTFMENRRRSRYGVDLESAVGLSKSFFLIGVTAARS